MPTGLGSRRTFPYSHPGSSRYISFARQWRIVIEFTWACACRTPFRDRSRRAPRRSRVRGRRDRAARERVLGCSRSPLPVVSENIISRLHDRVAREPALGVVALRRLVSQGGGRERIGRGVILERGPSPSAAVREPLAILH